MHMYRHTSNNNTIKEREAISLKVGGHGKGLREENEGGSDIKLFQLKTYFKNKRAFWLLSLSTVVVHVNKIMNLVINVLVH